MIIINNIKNKEDPNFDLSILNVNFYNVKLEIDLILGIIYCYKKSFLIGMWDVDYDEYRGC
jgi:hypothetical protein